MELLIEYAGLLPAPLSIPDLCPGRFYRFLLKSTHANVNEPGWVTARVRHSDGEYTILHFDAIVSPDGTAVNDNFFVVADQILGIYAITGYM